MMTTDRVIRLCSLRAADGGARVLLQLQIEEDGTARQELLSVFAARLAHLPQCGVLSEAEYLWLFEESAVSAAMDIGLRVLSANGASKAQLVQKICQRGVKKATAEVAASALAARGYLDEAAGAMREAERGIAKLWGDRRILADVRARGYEEAALTEVKQLLAGEDAVERCVRLIGRRRMAMPKDTAALSRFVAALVRYGYTVGEIKQAMRRSFGA